MSQQIVCIYTFNLVDSATDPQLVDASAKLDAIFLSMEGFQYRSLTKTTEGLWQDIMYWDSEEALKKVDAIETHDDFGAFMGLIDSNSVNHMNAVIHSSVYPEMPLPETQVSETQVSETA